MPLFPELRRVNSVQERVQWADSREDRFIRKMRAFRASQWIEARRVLRDLQPEVRSRILARWNTRFMPGQPAHLLALIRLDMKSHGETPPDSVCRIG